MSVDQFVSNGTSIILQLFDLCVFAVNRCTLDGEDTTTTFWQQLAWSSKWLYRGTWPTHNPGGERIREAKVGKPFVGLVWLCVVGKRGLGLHTQSSGIGMSNRFETVHQMQVQHADSAVD